MIMVTNDQFIRAVFGSEYLWCHVTDFTYDPGDIPKGKHLFAWKGDYYCRYKFTPGSNQYFTISTFYCDENQQARRRKALFRQTHCIVLDDVKEKLSVAQANKLPAPSWILETSEGSEQWGYILEQPCTDRSRVENLQDGLVNSGLVPDGKDPGLKGVTRYVRLPEGSNSKASKLVDGKPRPCVMLRWVPFHTVTMEQLAYPFGVMLDAVRREQRIDGAACVDDHPLLQIPDVIHIKEVRSDGRFDIRCPWVNEHTGADDSGSAMFTNADGSMGFKCHHGACQHRGGSELIAYIDGQIPGWSHDYLKMWQLTRGIDHAEQAQGVNSASVNQNPASFNSGTGVMTAASIAQALETLCERLKQFDPGSEHQRDLAKDILQRVDGLDKVDQVYWHDIVRDTMKWTKVNLEIILKDLRKKWYGDSSSKTDLYNRFVFVTTMNRFYDFKTTEFYTRESFHNSFSNEDPEISRLALDESMVRKVDKIDFAPGEPSVFIQDENNKYGYMEYANFWTDYNQPKGSPGDISPWVNHFHYLGWQAHRSHIEKWMAYTLRHPENKINHILLFGGPEGCGKDFILEPLKKGMGKNFKEIEGNKLISDFNKYLMNRKYIHINEIDLANHIQAAQVSNRLKPMAAAPPNTLEINRKNVDEFSIRNIVNVTMATNSKVPFKLESMSRRFYVLWSDFTVMTPEGFVKSGWEDYWHHMWEWMHSVGWEHVLYYLLNQVDLSDFKPFSRPVITDDLKDMWNASKSGLQQTIEAFINEQIGLFRSDLLTPTDMVNVIKSDNVFSKEYIYCDVRNISPGMIGKVLSKTGHEQRRGYRGYRSKSSVRIYILRNNDRYSDMTAKQLHDEYERQISVITGKKSNLTVLPKRA